jgi:hypothetical protein
MLTLADAQGLVPAPTGKVVVRTKSGNTRDIIAAILLADRHVGSMCHKLAAALIVRKGSGKNRRIDAVASLQALYDFVKGQIKYVNDPAGRELIRVPSATIRAGEGDCEDYSLLIAGVLKVFRVPAVFRFAAYQPGNVTHVYVVAYPKTTHPIVLDACYTGFNQEKPYDHKEDHYSRPLSTKGIKGLPMEKPDGSNGSLFGRSRLQLGQAGNFNALSAPELTLHIQRQIAQARAEAIERKHGVGNAAAIGYRDAEDVFTDAICAINNEEAMENVAGMLEDGNYSSLNHLRGNQDPYEHMALRAEMRTGRIADSIGRARKKGGKGTWTGNLLRKAAKGAKKGLKAFTRVLTAPQRLFAKGILEVSLPKSAPYFIYCFLDDAQAAKLPAKVQAKRKKAMKLRSFITDKIGMKQGHFMGIIQAGIIKRYGKEPKTVLRDMLGNKIAGIGLLPVIPILMEIIQVLMKAFGLKKDEADEIAPTDKDVASESDFDGLSPEEKKRVAANLKTQDFSQEAKELESTGAPENTPKKGWCHFN